MCWGSAACSRAKRRQEGLLYVDKERGLPLLAILRLARTSLPNAVMQLDRWARQADAGLEGSAPRAPENTIRRRCGRRSTSLWIR